jgi:hypothetical protein
VEITIDEWIVHFLSEKNKREIALDFLNKVHRKCDRLVTVRGGSLDQKIWNMAKISQNWDIEGRIIAKWFMSDFRNNSKKFLVLEEPDLEPLPPGLEHEIPEDDVYLAKTAVSTSDHLIVTTDTRLKERLSGRIELTIRLVDEFLKTYNY